MIVPAYVRKAIRSWSAWRSKNRLYRAVPELRDLDRLQVEIARQHRPGSRAIAHRKVEVVSARLAAECGRSA